MQPIRIQKALSEAGVASRRAAEELVRMLLQKRLMATIKPHRSLLP